MKNSQEYFDLISQNRLENALQLIDRLIKDNPHDSLMLFERGKLRWKMGDRAGATGDYAKSVEINPESPAKYALEQADEIASFFNPDLYNP